MTNNTHEMHSEEYDAAVEGEMRKMEEERLWVMLSKEDCANRKDVTSSLYAFKRL